MTTDLLLINATNYRPNLIFPYAFVQVRAVARAHGLRVESSDLFGYDAAVQQRHLARLIERTQPRAVGFHLRQCDSLVLADYVSPHREAYHPLEATRAAIRQVREVYSGPVVIGGFGFTTRPEGVLQFLEADLGVTGEPDAFFARLSDVLRGAADVENVVRASTPGSTRRYFPPLDEREYDDEIVEQMERFYGQSVLYGEQPPSVAVELARGCLFRCDFCAEPAVKGRRIAERNLDAVFGDVEFLVSRGVRSFWMVCSELNQGSAELGRRVAERFIHLQERHPNLPLKWRAYVLPRWLEDGDLALLHRSGFAGGWNDFPSLDDRNLSANRVPYRTKHIHEHLTQTLRSGPGARSPEGAKFGTFLGNAHSDPAAVVRTFDYFDEHFRGKFKSAEIGVATRLLGTMSAQTLRELEPLAVSFSAEGVLDTTDITHPTYAVPRALASILGGHAATGELFEYARVTFLSEQFELGLSWSRFLRQSAENEWLKRHLQDLPLRPPPGLENTAVAKLLSALAASEPSALQSICEPESGDARAANLVAGLLARRLFRRHPEAGRILAWLGFSDLRHVTPWKLFRACSLKASSLEELQQLMLRENDGVEPEAGAWLMRYLTFRYNTRLTVNWSRLVTVGSASERSLPRTRVHLQLAAV